MTVVREQESAEAVVPRATSRISKRPDAELGRQTRLRPGYGEASTTIGGLEPER